MNLRKLEYRATLIAGIVLMATSIYYVVYGSYEDLVLAVLLLGLALGFDTVAVTLHRKSQNQENEIKQR